MDKIILKNKTEIEVTQMPSIGSVTVQLENVSALQSLKDSLTEDNLSEVKTTNEAGFAVGNYEDLILQPDWKVRWNDDGIQATFGLREMTETERRLSELEAGQQVQDGAISDLGSAVSDIAEGGAE